MPLETRHPKPEPLKVVVCGALGRTGGAVLQGLARSRRLTWLAALRRTRSRSISTYRAAVD